MTFTVLFDLDDTLIRNEMGVFLPAYFQSIQEFMSVLIPPERMMPFFLAASQRMLSNDSPAQTLSDAFFADFLRDIQVPYETIWPLIERFYVEQYPELKRLTAVIPAAQAVVETFARRGYRMAVATNPLFPHLAVLERVSWAELPVSPEKFELITANEAFHFAKPNAAYYAETLAYMGWPDGPIVMVGNDPVNDVAGASRLGLATYQVAGTDPSADPRENSPLHTYGEFSGLPNWLDNQPAEAFMPVYETPDAILAIIKSTAAALQTFSRIYGPERWDTRIGDSWTPREVLHHLKDVEAQVNLPRLRSFEQVNNPFISGVDTDAWHRDGFKDLKTVDAVFADFLALRMDTISRLTAFDETDWQLPARHAIFGPTSLREIARIMAGHDQLHIRQIREVFTAS